jgi:hypothetical protein
MTEYGERLLERGDRGGGLPEQELKPARPKRRSRTAKQTFIAACLFAPNPFGKPVKDRGLASHETKAPAKSTPRPPSKIHHHLPALNLVPPVGDRWQAQAAPAGKALQSPGLILLGAGTAFGGIVPADCVTTCLGRIFPFAGMAGAEDETAGSGRIADLGRFELGRISNR